MPDAYRKGLQGKFFRVCLRQVFTTLKSALGYSQTIDQNENDGWIRTHNEPNRAETRSG